MTIITTLRFPQNKSAPGPFDYHPVGQDILVRAVESGYLVSARVLGYRIFTNGYPGLAELTLAGRIPVNGTNDTHSVEIYDRDKWLRIWHDVTVEVEEVEEPE